MRKKDALYWCWLCFVMMCFTRVNAQQAPRRDYAASLAINLLPDKKIVYKTTGETELRLHFFFPANFKPTDQRSVFVAIHGGAWTGGEPRRFYPFVKLMTEEGMVGISIEYRLLKKGLPVTVFDCVKDARSAIRYVRAHSKEMGIDPNRIVVSGGSAGGHLAVGTAIFSNVDDSTDDRSISPLPNALVLYYPVIDTSPEGYGSKIIGSKWKELSPLHQVKNHMPPTAIFHGTGDTVTPYKGVQLFMTAMKKAGNKCKIFPNEGGIHGYMMFDQILFNETIKNTKKFLRSQYFI